MKKINSRIIKFLEAGTIISTFLLVASVSVQIFARFALESAPSWTEEASRYFFIYTIGFASGLAFKEDYFVSMDIVYKGLKESNKRIIDLFNQVLITGLFILISLYAIQFINIGYAETSPSLGIRMSFAFASILVMSCSISYFGISQLIVNLKGNK